VLPRRTLHKFLRGFALCNPLRDHAALRFPLKQAPKSPVEQQLHLILHRFPPRSAVYSSSFVEVGARCDQTMLRSDVKRMPIDRFSSSTGTLSGHETLGSEGGADIHRGASLRRLVHEGM
jgi:hypothetical protein